MSTETDPEYLEKILTQDNMEQQGESRLELDARRKDGSVFPLAIKISSYVIYGSKMFTAIVDDVSEHKAMIENLRRLAEHDGLTGLYNRYYFMQEVEHLVKRVGAKASRILPCSILIWTTLNMLTTPWGILPVMSYWFKLH